MCFVLCVFNNSIWHCLCCIHIGNNTDSQSERSVSASSPAFLSHLLLCFLLLFSSLLHPPFLSILLRWPWLSAFSSLFSSHCITCLAQRPSQFPPAWKMVFFMCFMQISPSNTHSISKKKSPVAFFSHIHVGRFPAVHLAFKRWKYFCTLAFCSLVSHGFLWVLIEAN